MEKLFWLSAGAIIGFVGGYSYFKKNFDRKKKPAENNSTNQVIFFPSESASENNVQFSSSKNSSNQSLEQLIQHVSSAKNSIDLCLYMVTIHNLGKPIFDLMESSKVRVRLIVDHSFAQVSGSLVSELRKRGAFVRSKKSDYLMHHKFAIIDGRLILSGSFNWTMQAAMGNEENVIVSSESNIVKPFCNHFEKMWLELE